MSCKDIIRALKKLGFYKVGGRGDHMKFANGKGMITVVPYRGSKQLAHGTINAICKQVGVSKKELEKYF